jgi:acetylglutamate kinase
VVAPLAEGPLNVNADTAAAHLAGRLAAARLVIAGATRGVLDESGATIAVLDDGRIDDLVKSGGVHAGMIAKLNACRRALSGGVSEVVIVDGRNIEQLEAVARGLSGAGTTLVQGASC